MRTPTVLQMEAVECGAACLAMMLAYHRRHVPLAELRLDCGVSRDGSKASNMLRAARRHGMVAKGYRKELDQLTEVDCPYIVFWNFDHFVVVEGFRKGKVYINDPAAGPRVVSYDEFDESFTGVVLVMEPGPQFERRRAQSKSLLAGLLSRLKGCWPPLLFCQLLGILLVIPAIALPIFSQVFVDHILVQGRHGWLRGLVLGMICLTVLQAMMQSLQLLFLRRVGTKLSVTLSGKFLWHLLALPASFYGQRFAGEVTDRLELNDELADFVSGSLMQALINLLMIALYGGVMLLYDVPLTLIACAFAAVNFIGLALVARARMDASAILLQEQGKAAGVAIAGIQSIETLKSGAQENDFFTRWVGYYTKGHNVSQTIQLISANLGLMPVLLSSLATTLVLVIGGLRVIEGHLTIGMLVAFQGFMLMFNKPIQEFIGLGAQIQELFSKIERLDDVLANPRDPQLEAPLELTSASAVRLNGRLELRGLTFGYSKVEKPLIEGFDLVLEPGQSVALVGSSGSGKSTIARLVSGLYEPWEGEILFDGQPRSRWPREVLVESLAMVEQEIFLFRGTVRDNLTLWDETVPQADLVRACRDAEIHETIVQLQGGYEATLLEGGANLSGGQRQRLEIARALVRNPALLVLDEATSALDVETESRIARNLPRRGCSQLLVAHRLSTIRDCDEIIVLSAGRIVQRGTHESMIVSGGPYAELIASEGGALDPAA